MPRRKRQRRIACHFAPSITVCRNQTKKVDCNIRTKERKQADKYFWCNRVRINRMGENFLWRRQRPMGVCCKTGCCRRYAGRYWRCCISNGKGSHRWNGRDKKNYGIIVGNEGAVLVWWPARTSNPLVTWRSHVRCVRFAHAPAKL